MIPKKRADGKECACCHYEAKDLKEYDYPIHRSAEGKRLLCSLCANSFAGIINGYPDQHPNCDTYQLAAQMFCANAILDAIEEAREKLH